MIVTPELEGPLYHPQTQEKKRKTEVLHLVCFEGRIIAKDYWMNLTPLEISKVRTSSFFFKFWFRFNKNVILFAYCVMITFIYSNAGGGGLVDLDIICLGEVKIKVHKIVMAAASSFFRVSDSI